jgi:hypothetical protein
MNEDDIVAKAKRLLSVLKTSQTDDLIDLILHKNFSTEQLTRICNLNIKD